MVQTAKARFGTTINCMDGRSVEATIIWMKKKFRLDHIDAITEPGMVALIGRMDEEARAWLKKKLGISILHHGSRTVTVVGHADCAGNPVDAMRHEADIAKSVVAIRELVSEIAHDEKVEVLGLYVFFDSNERAPHAEIRKL